MLMLKLGKYFEIVLSITIFLLLYSGILGINYFISLEISDDAHAMQLASRQTRLSQQILAELYATRDNLEAGTSIEAPILELTQSFRQFDEVLDSFIYGGELIGAGQNQDNFLINADYAEVNRSLLNQIETLWRPYRARISPVMYSIYTENFDLEKTLGKTEVAISSARETNPEMLKLLNEFTDTVDALGKDKVERLQIIQGIGIAIAIIYFSILMLYFVRKLGRSDRAAESARGETEEILATVNEGLFLLDKDLNLGSQHSKILCSMFNSKELAGSNFIELIRPMVSDKTLNTTTEFLSLMFEEHVQASLIQSLNPLNEVEMHIPKNEYELEKKHYCFQFSPVEKKGQLLDILVSITDITERVQLKNELDVSNKNSSQEVALLLSIIHIKPELLAEGLASTKRGLAEINELLKTPATKTEQLWKKHLKIGRIAHRVKGDCAAIEMMSIADAMHELEDTLDEIKEKGSITGNDFLPIALKLDLLHKQIQLVQNAIERINGLRKAMKKTARGENKEPEKKTSKRERKKENPWGEMISNLAESIAKQYQKELKVDMSELDPRIIPLEKQARIRDAVVQLIRNASVHGIESPEDRVNAGKPLEGRIDIYSKSTEKSDAIYIRDDGRGIALDQIKSVLKKQGTLNEAELNELEPKELIRMLFKPGFSTKQTVDINAGRGIGLDLVKSSVESCGAKLSLKFKSGAFTEFKITIPKKAELSEVI